MQEITITIEKNKVMHEIAKATSYTGAKMMADDPGAYDRIFVSDEEREMLERYWVEACSLVTDGLKEWLETVSAQPIHHGVDIQTNYTVTLKVADLYPVSLNDSVKSDLTNFMVGVILSKWYRLTNKSESEAYATESGAILVNAVNKLFTRKRPTRPTASIGLGMSHD